MSIDRVNPPGSGGVDGPRFQRTRPDGANAAREVAGAGPVQRPATPAEGQDRVEVSDAARALSDLAQAGGTPSSLSAERLKQVLARLRDGTYDRPATLDAIARRILDELNQGRSGNGA
jgi:Anti-sigma-28 factor, FlgM